MLDDGHGPVAGVRPAHLVDQAPGRVGVEDVQVGELLAPVLDHVVPPRVPPHDPVAGAVLVGILPVPQRTGPLEGQVDGGGKDGGIVVLRSGRAGRGGRGGLVEPVHDGRVVGGGVGEGVPGQPEAGLGRQRAAPAQLVEDGAVGRGGDHDADVGVVLGRGADHGRTADVDELDGGIRAEGVEVAHHEVDGPDALALQVGQVLGLRAIGQDAPVDGRVEGLDPASEHLGGTGEVGHLHVVDAGLGQGRRRPAARDQLPAQSGQPLSQVDGPGLVVDGQQCPHGATSGDDPGPSPAVAASRSTKARMVSG